MKIAGVEPKNDPRRRKMRGDPIEHTPQKKVELAVKDAVIAKNSADKIYWAEKVKVTSQVTITSKGPPTRKWPYANNVYRAEGEVVIRPHEVKTDKTRPRTSHKFRIQFEDVPDQYNMPEIKIREFTLDN